MLLLTIGHGSRFSSAGKCSVLRAALIDRPLQLKAQKPELEQQQRAGRALLWDKQVDRKIWGEYREARVAQKPYVYQTNAD